MRDYIAQENIDEFDRDFHSSRMHTIAMNAVASVGPSAAAKRWQGRPNAVHQYSISLDQHGVTNQMHSGRCWMFAALNCLRFHVIHKLNLDEFELSQNFTLFYDKLEKANYFYESIFKTFDEETEGRIITHLVRDPVQDGGQWDMISALIMKYGAVPKEIMPETACSSDTGEMNAVLTEKLRKDAATLRRAHEEGKSMEELRELKRGCLEEVYRVLCICLGTPPDTFDFKIRAKDGRYISDCGLTPREFYDKYIGLDLTRFVSLINAPTEDKPYMRSYTVKYLGNVIDGKPVKYVNVPLEVMKKAAIEQLRDGTPVWFGCDVGKYSDRDSGLMDTEAFDFETLFDTEFTMTKADRLEYGHSMMTHAMTFQGVDIAEDGSPVRWRVENSWGDDPGNKGMYIMTDAWFDRYLYQIVVNRKYLTRDVLDAYDAEPIVLAPWDPMGALAQGAE